MTRVEPTHRSVSDRPANTREPLVLAPGNHVLTVPPGATVQVVPVPPPGRRGHWVQGTTWASNATLESSAPRAGFAVSRVHEARPIEQTEPSRQVFAVSVPADARGQHRYGAHFEWRDRTGAHTSIRCAIELRIE